MTPLRKLGTSDPEVFPFNLGGNVFGWAADKDQSFAVLDAYAAAGGDFIDVVAAAHDAEVATAALAWPVPRPTVVAPIASVRTVDQLPAAGSLRHGLPIVLGKG